jgi:hypothetical protein
LERKFKAYVVVQGFVEALVSNEPWELKDVEIDPDYSDEQKHA